MAKISSFIIGISEAEFQSQVTQLAENLGWQWMHVVTTGTGHNFPLRGTMKKGWPDLMLVRRERMIFAELKGERGLVTPLQQWCLAILDQAGAEAYVWRPSQLAEIAGCLT